MSISWRAFGPTIGWRMLCENSKAFIPLVHEEIQAPDFAWQEGYGAFTVSASQCDAVRHYISRQEEHHRTRTFQEEYVEFLRRCGVVFDPRYV